MESEFHHLSVSMCLIVFAYEAHPDYPFILAANRDEFYERPTSIAQWWKDYPDILGGRDLKANGTWMGINKKGHFAAVTNYRDISNIREDAKSRGDLAVNFLSQSNDTVEYATQIKDEGSEYNGFNLLVLNDDMAHVSNYENKVNNISSGIYGLSNALLDTSWPKVEKAKKKFKEVIGRSFHEGELLEIMNDQEIASDEDLPSTGVAQELERALSAMCIRTPNYGTCCSTVVTINTYGEVRFLEKSYPVGNRKDEIVSYSFMIER